MAGDGESEVRRRKLRREEVAVVLAAVATAVVLVERFVDEHSLLVMLPGNAAAALQSSMQAASSALAKLQMMFSLANPNTTTTTTTTTATITAAADDKEKRNARKLHCSSSPGSSVQPVEETEMVAVERFHEMLQSGDDIQWRDNFRMSKRTFFRLLESLGPALQGQETSMQDVVPVDRKLGSALYRLAHGATFKVVARRFGIGTSSCCEVFYAVCKGLEEKLGHLFDFPTSVDRLRSISCGFGLPNCCGVVGCTSFAVERPTGEMGIEYLDHTRSYSVVMQGVVDSKARFLDISVGWPGCIPPQTILHKTRFYSRVRETRELLQGPSLDLGNGILIPQYVLGDRTYCLQPWFITPYPESDEFEESLFNRAHRDAMRPLRRAFGMLKEQWQLLRTKQRVDNIELLPFVVAACCVLQNFLIDNGEPMPEVEESEQREPAMVDDLPDVFGESVRSALAALVGGR